MRTLTSEEISAVRAPLERASTLPPRCYLDPEFYELEVEQVFRKQWLAAGAMIALLVAGPLWDLAGTPVFWVFGAFFVVVAGMMIHNAYLLRDANLLDDTWQ